MERGVYFDGWFPRQHCYHPSLPPRRLRMVEDLVDYKATVLVWSALGGGSVSLPYLEEEAFQRIDPRFRFYGFLNDAEFIKACDENGIKVFGIVFEVQGWEFPIELNEAEDEVLALNELRGEGKRDWFGLREFNQDRYPKLWKPWRSYFPDGIVNSDGEQVTDILEEGVSRDIHGNALHSDWVEAADREHYCYLMDRNNPAWREYLKGIIRVQIDAGVHGVQLDEADLPYFSTGYGGCFCKDCMKQFRAYLQRLPESERPRELDGAELESFHYGKWLLAQGYDFKDRQAETPLFWTYKRWQREEITGYFAELSDYIREYGRSKGREVLVSGNLYYLSAHYYPFEPHLDMLITEMDSTSFRQPEWSRYAACFAGDKPVIVAENPYGGVIPALVEDLHEGRGYDLYRMTMYEAAALGINMTVPYGAWLGSVIEDSFWAPHEVTLEIQEFLASNERLFARATHSDTALVFSIESNFQLAELGRASVDNPPFWDVSRTMVSGGQPYDVVMFPEGKLRGDTVTAEELLRYGTLVLPECRYLTPQQADALAGFLDGGGKVVIIGDLGLNLEVGDRARLAGHANVTTLVSVDDFNLDALPRGPQIRWEGARPDLAVNVQRTEEGAAVHIIRYDYNKDTDSVPVLPELAFEIRLDHRVVKTETHSPAGGKVRAYMEQRNARTRVVLRDVPLYSIVLLKKR